MKYDVFISYKSELISLVEQFVNIIEQKRIDGHQISCWYAPRNLDEGATVDDFDDEILSAIKDCSMAVAFLNDAALNSKWVKFEIDQAWDRDKFILPVAVDELKTDNAVVAKLSSKHRINAYPDPEKYIDKIVQKACAQLNRKNGPADNEKSNPQPFNSVSVYDKAQALEEANELREAVKLYLQAAQQGNANAQARLCQLFYDHGKTLGEICSGDETNTIRQEADRQGNPWACFQMHCLYYDSLHQKAENNAKSFEYVERASQSGNIPLAWLRLGIHYGWGLGVRQDHALEMFYYKKAFDAGCMEACSFIGQTYQYGNDKIKEDLQQAKYYFNKGAEHGDRRCMYDLTWLYLDEDDTEEARKIAHQLIDLGYNYGYVLLGEIADQEDEKDEAVRMFKQAIKLDQYEAYGDLAFYQWNEGNREEAYRLARKGCAMEDLKSYWFLAFFYKEEERYDEAWDAILVYYLREGSGADLMGEIFFDCGYRKEDPAAEALMEQQLKDALEVCARNGNEDSMKYLLLLIAMQEAGEEDPDTKLCMKIPQALEMIKLGAEMKMPSMMCHYGFILLDDDYPKSNPLKGLLYLQDAALAGDEDALSYLLYYGKKGKYAQDIDLPKLAFHAMIFSDLKMGADVICMGILHAIQKLKHASDEWLQSRCRGLIDLLRAKGYLGYVKQLGSDLLMFYPDYDETKERQMLMEKGYIDLLYYIINYASEYENNMQKLDQREMRPSYEVSELWKDGSRILNVDYDILCVRYHTDILFSLGELQNLKSDYIPSNEAEVVNVCAIRAILQLSAFCGDYQDDIINAIPDPDAMLELISQMDLEDKDLKKFIYNATRLHQEALKVMYNNSEMEATTPMVEPEEKEVNVDDVEEIKHPRVYVCCQDKQDQVAVALTDYLQQAGIDCWYAGRDMDENQEYETQINEAIDHCEVAIAMIDNEAVQSADITQQLIRVWNQKKPIIPFVLGAIKVRNNLTAKIAMYQKIYAYPHPEFYFSDVKLRIGKFMPYCQKK